MDSVAKWMEAAGQGPGEPLLGLGDLPDLDGTLV